jgi:deoxyribonuclease V
VQQELARAQPPPWSPRRPEDLAIGAVFVCFERGPSGPGRKDDPAWAAAAVLHRGRVTASAVVTGRAGAPYEAGLLALREGALLEAAVRALPGPPDVLLVDATGRDHPRRAGLALHLGAILEIPTVGVTHRPLLAGGAWPEDRRGAQSPLHLDAELAGHWLRTRAGTRPLAIHAAWRTDPDVALAVVGAAADRARAPEPLREARRLARTRRAGR